MSELVTLDRAHKQSGQTEEVQGELTSLVVPAVTTARLAAQRPSGDFLLSIPIRLTDGRTDGRREERGQSGSRAQCLHGR